MSEKARDFGFGGKEWVKVMREEVANGAGTVTLYWILSLSAAFHFFQKLNNDKNK